MTEYLTIENIGLAAVCLVAFASTLVKVLDKITDVHPNERLDSHITRARRYIATAKAVLDKLALNPKR